jgi:hypothetical protein
LKIGRETCPDLTRLTGRPQVSVLRFRFAICIIVSPYFLLILSLIASGIE